MRSALLLSAAIFVAALMPQAFALPLDIESDFEAATVVSLLDDKRADSEAVLYEISLDTEAETILRNGTELGARITLRGQRDHPLRPGFAGDFGTGSALAGAYSGLSGGFDSAETGARGRVEAAYLRADGGYGELRIGKDRGVAARFFEGAPSALTYSAVANPYLDPTGLKINRTNHDVTGPSAKLSYASPRILGLRAGLSFTPEGDGQNLDRSLSDATGQPGLGNVVEAAANLSRTLRASGIRIEASLAWSAAEPDDVAGLTRDRMETWSLGANIERDDTEFGISLLQSDNGFSGGDYSAWEAGLAHDFGETRVSLNYGEADDDLARLSSEGVSIAAKRELSDGFDVALSYQHERLSTSGSNRTSKGVVVEITLQADFFEMSRN